MRKQPRYGVAGKVGRMKIARTFKSASPCDLTSMGHFSFPSFLFIRRPRAPPFSRAQPALSLSLPFPRVSSFLRADSRHLSQESYNDGGERLEKSLPALATSERESERACLRFFRRRIPSRRAVAFCSARFRASTLRDVALSRLGAHPFLALCRP